MCVSVALHTNHVYGELKHTLIEVFMPFTRILECERTNATGVRTCLL